MKNKYTQTGLGKVLCTVVFREIYLTTANPTLTMACEGTQQNLTLRKWGTEQYVATKNVDPI
jgi:hypothetical protein